MHAIGLVCICKEGVGIAVNPKAINLIGPGHLVFSWIDISVVDRLFGSLCWLDTQVEHLAKSKLVYSWYIVLTLLTASS